MKYVQANLHEKQKEKAFRVYVSEAAKNFNYILASVYNGEYMALHYEEMMKPQLEEETRTAEEVIEHIRNELRRLS